MIFNLITVKQAWKALSGINEEVTKLTDGVMIFILNNNGVVRGVFIRIPNYFNEVFSGVMDFKVCYFRQN